MTFNMTPPELKKLKLKPGERVYRLLIRQTLDYIVVDREDFEVLKDIQLTRQPDGSITTMAGQPVAEYLKIPGKRIDTKSPFDFRRLHYAE